MLPSISIFEPEVKVVPVGFYESTSMDGLSENKDLIDLSNGQETGEHQHHHQFNVSLFLLLFFWL